MPDWPLPLPALLSQVLVAMTVGLDNALEQRMAHRTAAGRRRGLPGAGPWLASWVLWANLLRVVPADGIALADLQAHPEVDPRWLSGRNPGPVRWGYLTLAGGVVRPTPALRRAAERVFPGLPAAVEAAWSERLGAGAVDELAGALDAVAAAAVPAGLPRYLPQLDNRMRTCWDRPAGAGGAALVDRLARVLLAYALEHERSARVPLAMAANLVRVVEPGGTPARDLPRRAGISREAMAFLTGWRQVPRLTVESDSGVVTLTPAGAAAGAEYARLAGQIEAAWRDRCGRDVLDRLRAALERVVVDPELERSPLAALVVAPEGGWRSWSRPPRVLPHFPMVLHRGGYPDGA